MSTARTVRALCQSCGHELENADDRAEREAIQALYEEYVRHHAVDEYAMPDDAPPQTSPPRISEVISDIRMRRAKAMEEELAARDRLRNEPPPNWDEMSDDEQWRYVYHHRIDYFPQSSSSVGRKRERE